MIIHGTGWSHFHINFKIQQKKSPNRYLNHGGQTSIGAFPFFSLPLSPGVFTYWASALIGVGHHPNMMEAIVAEPVSAFGGGSFISSPTPFINIGFKTHWAMIWFFVQFLPPFRVLFNPLLINYWSGVCWCVLARALTPITKPRILTCKLVSMG